MAADRRGCAGAVPRKAGEYLRLAVPGPQLVQPEKACAARRLDRRMGYLGISLDLIAHFHENAKCTNENAGGGGNENATELYIVAKKHYEQPLNDGDQLEHLLEPSSLFDFETINI